MDLSKNELFFREERAEWSHGAAPRCPGAADQFHVRQSMSLSSVLATFH
jgi:hypothetical protein